jgi:small subunit ribosomal protein S20
MANTKSAIKYVRKTERRAAHNRGVRSRLKTLARKVRESEAAGNKEEAGKSAREFISALDKAAKTGIIHGNVVNRHKASCSHLIFNS